MRKQYLWVIAVVVLVLVATLLLAACGGSTTSTTAGPATTAGATTTAGAVDAAALYAQYCALPGCHGVLPTGAAADVKTVIESGTGNIMPAFTDKLTADQITALAAWVANGGQ